MDLFFLFCLHFVKSLPELSTCYHIHFDVPTKLHIKTLYIKRKIIQKSLKKNIYEKQMIATETLNFHAGKTKTSVGLI